MQSKDKLIPNVQSSQFESHPIIFSQVALKIIDRDKNPTYRYDKAIFKDEGIELKESKKADDIFIPWSDIRQLDYEDIEKIKFEIISASTNNMKLVGLGTKMIIRLNTTNSLSNDLSQLKKGLDDLPFIIKGKPCYECGGWFENGVCMVCGISLKEIRREQAKNSMKFAAICFFIGGIGLILMLTGIAKELPRILKGVVGFAAIGGCGLGLAFILLGAYKYSSTNSE
ncbi:MAG: hypothetical protein PVG03_03705 [Desulfarculaceae bacterium]